MPPFSNRTVCLRDSSLPGKKPNFYFLLAWVVVIEVFLDCGVVSTKTY